MTIDELTGEVIKKSLKIHSKLGPACFERVYEEVLYYELIKSGLNVWRQVRFPITYEELEIKNACRLDLLVEKKLVVELKSVFALHPIYFDQVRTQLVLLNLKHGLLLNFKVSGMKDGIHRVFNNRGRESLSE